MVALAIGPALKGKETTAIVISVVCRGCAIPVAWRIMRANKPGAWMDPVVELLQALAPAAPEEMKVIVLCGRGLTSPELWEQIRARRLPPVVAGGWHPYMRYPKNTAFRYQHWSSMEHLGRGPVAQGLAVSLDALEVEVGPRPFLFFAFRRRGDIQASYAPAQGRRHVCRNDNVRAPGSGEIQVPSPTGIDYNDIHFLMVILPE